MRVQVYKTHVVRPGESLITVIDNYLPRLEEKSIVVITSKIISISQKKMIPVDAVSSKKTLVQQEADAFLPNEHECPYGIYLTIKNNILIPSAGIDESNADGYYLLYPDNIQECAQAIWQHLKTRDGLKEVGVIITDSHTTPLRKGVTGIALGWCGFESLRTYVGQPDLFGKPLRVTQVNNVDALAAAAVFCMGEGAECTPLAVIQEAPSIVFNDVPPSKQEIENFHISLDEDIYKDLLTSVRWVWNKKE